MRRRRRVRALVEADRGPGGRGARGHVTPEIASRATGRRPAAAAGGGSRRRAGEFRAFSPPPHVPPAPFRNRFPPAFHAAGRRRYRLALGLAAAGRREKRPARPPAPAAWPPLRAARARCVCCSPRALTTQALSNGTPAGPANRVDGPRAV